jgi:molybdate transport system permease protein
MPVWQITAFTIATALGATALMLPPGLLIAWWLARRKFPGQTLVETLVSLPLVMPPVATGLILLMLLAPRGVIGRLLARLGIDVVFTWKAVVVAMAVMALPLFVRAARAGFEQVDRRYEAVAATLGARPLRIFFTVTLPLAAPAVAAGAVLGFARAVGEFGATIMIAGSLPGTRTLAVAIYSFAETGRDREAAALLVVSAVIAFLALYLSNRIAARPGLRA